MEYILTIVKFTSLIVAAAFAIWGTTIDFRKKSKMAKKGRIAIVTVIVTSLVSAIAIGLEENDKYKKKIESDNAKKLADEKSQADQKRLYEEFEKLFKNTKENIDKTQENIGKTGETLNRTNEVAHDVKKNLESQTQLIGKSQQISKALDGSVKTQGELLKTSNTTLENSFEQIYTQKEMLITSAETLKETIGLTKKQNELQEQQFVAIKNTLRVLNPVTKMKLAYTLKYEWHEDDEYDFLNNYVQNIKAIAEEHKNDSSFLSPFFITKNIKDEIVQVRIAKDSAYFPLIFRNEKIPESRQKEDKAFELLNRSALELRFYKNEPSLWIRSYAANGNYKKFNPDKIEFKPCKSRLREDEETSLKLTINFEGDYKGIYLTVETNDLSWCKSNNQIISFVDFSEASLIITAPYNSTLEEFAFFSGENYSTAYCIKSFTMSPNLPFDSIYLNEGKNNPYFTYKYLYRFDDQELKPRFCWLGIIPDADTKVDK